MNETTPLVSICCLTYNHARFVRQCLDGFLMQKTDFPFEILVHDDASTDGTDDILREYEAKYPDKVFALYEKENRFTHGYRGRMDIVFNYSRARGKYIASCEGDDYWTDPLKLQKQVDFMESHPEYSICFHRCQRYNEQTGQFEPDLCGPLFARGEQGVDITIEMFFKDWITQPLTMLFRTAMFSPEWQKRYKYYRDQHEIYHLLKAGKGYLFAFVGGVYRLHAGGIASQISKAQYCTVTLPIDKEFYRKNRIPEARHVYGETLQCHVDLYADTNKWKALRYALEQLFVTRGHKTFWHNMKRIF